MRMCHSHRSAGKSSAMPAVLWLVLLMTPASGQDAAPTQAIHFLAQAQAVNDTCHFLSDSARDELAGYVARAEVAAVEKLGPAAVRAAMIQGRAEGKAAGCTETARGNLNETLIAARQAVTRIDGPAAKPEGASGTASALTAPEAATAQTALAAPVDEAEPPAVKNPVPRRTALPSARPTAKAPASTKAKAPPGRVAAKPAPARPAAAKARSSALASYGTMAERYYYARRCGGMSDRQIMGFYGQVVATHRAAVSAFGVPAVAGVMRGAEIRARTRTCG